MTFNTLSLTLLTTFQDKESVQIFQRPLDVKDDVLDSQIQRLELGKGPAKKEWEELCGDFYLRAILRDQKKNVMSFQALQLEKPCNNATSQTATSTEAIQENFVENPALSIEVELASDTVSSGINRGVKNPFGEIGIKSMKVVNKIQLCQDTAKCDGITYLLPRGKNFILDLIAFYVPVTEDESGLQ